MPTDGWTLFSDFGLDLWSRAIWSWTIGTLWSWTIHNSKEFSKSHMLQDHTYLKCTLLREHVCYMLLEQYALAIRRSTKVKLNEYEIIKKKNMPTDGWTLFSDFGLDLWSRAIWSWTIGTLWSWTIHNSKEFSKSHMLQDHTYLKCTLLQEHVCYMLLEQYAFQIWSWGILNLKYSSIFLMVQGHKVLMVQEHMVLDHKSEAKMSKKWGEQWIIYSLHWYSSLTPTHFGWED